MPPTKSRARGASRTTVEAPAPSQPATETSPEARTLPVLALRDVVFFPNVIMPLLIGRRSSLGALDEAGLGSGDVLLVAQRDASDEEPGGSDLFRTGVIARVIQLSRLPNGSSKVLLEGRERARVTRFVRRRRGILHADVRLDPLVASGHEDARLTDATARRAVALFEEYVELQRRIPPEVIALVQSAVTPERQAYGIAAHVPAALEVRQRILESATLEDAFSAITVLLAGEIEVLRIERKLDDDTRGAMYQTQREFYLQEQLKLIHRELGQDDADDVSELESSLQAKALPEPVRMRVQRELRKLRRMAPTSPEYTVSRNFLDWIGALPWDERTTETLDVAHARRVLDEDHYGLQDVKDRILDFIAVLSLVGRIDGPILCLVGPPGVGKTSLGRSIARALGRKFVRMSLGGVRDEAEIRGHRRTYIGSMPGRVIQAMRKAEVVNPVILLDEIDKLGLDYRGDPAAALLEVLDPEQNSAFNDHYLEVDYDLSQALFVTTANSLATIPDALRDRMEIIRVPGYLDQEKLAIARKYLVPRQLEANGLDVSEVKLDADVLPAILRSYTREAGVRELDRQIAKLARKLARRQAEAGDQSIASQHVAASDLHGMLGVERYDADLASLEDKVGVARGLAYTTAGGETLEIEVSVVRGRGKISLTGTLGDVMKESASAAMSYVRGRADELGVAADFYRTRDIHIHIPDGATPKDGPSAGIAIATAVASALTGIPVRGDLAMTGEITLRGRVLPIGGLKEKSVAAHRNHVVDVIIPHANARDLEELPQEVRDAIRFHPVKTMDEVLKLALRGASPDVAAQRTRKRPRSQAVAAVSAH
ncbi:MAG TPA: endopeptidase La [Gemmatimonadaceae bacterium]|nr:endopeptidase La [Gemmatimonadaceae bacterium]